MLCLSLAACDKEVVSTRTAEETAEEFLRLYYSADAGDRYQNYLMEIDSALSDDAGQAAEKSAAAFENYYEDFVPLVSDKCLQGMQTNRWPLSYDQYYQDVTVEVVDVSVAQPDKNGRQDYSVTVSADGKEQKYSGEIELSDGENIVITYFWPM